MAGNENFVKISVRALDEGDEAAGFDHSNCLYCHIII